MGKIGFKQGFIEILSNGYFGNGEKMRIVPWKYWDLDGLGGMAGEWGNSDS